MVAGVGLSRCTRKSRDTSISPATVKLHWASGKRLELTASLEGSREEISNAVGVGCDFKLAPRRRAG